MFTDKELSDYYNGMTEAEKQGYSHNQFIAEVKRVLDPKNNAAILDEMVEMRHRDSIGRQNKAAIDRAARNAKIGLR